MTRWTCCVGTSTTVRHGKSRCKVLQSTERSSIKYSSSIVRLRSLGSLPLILASCPPFRTAPLLRSLCPSLHPSRSYLSIASYGLCLCAHVLQRAVQVEALLRGQPRAWPLRELVSTLYSQLHSEAQRKMAEENVQKILRHLDRFLQRWQLRPCARCMLHVVCCELCAACVLYAVLYVVCCMLCCMFAWLHTA